MRLGYYLLWHFFRILFRIGFARRIYHVERVPSQGPVLIAANHASFMDPPLIGSSLPREITYLARDTLFRFPIFASFLQYINVIPVDRGGKSPRGLKVIASRLKAGHPVILSRKALEALTENYDRPNQGLDSLPSNRMPPFFRSGSSALSRPMADT